MGGVDAHVEVFHIPPGAAGIQLVELGPAAVYALDLLLQLPVGQVLFSGGFLPATLLHYISFLSVHQFGKGGKLYREI